MARHVHIVSVGTSILANLSAKGFTLSGGAALKDIASFEDRGERLLADATARTNAAERLVAEDSLSAELTALARYAGSKEVDQVFLIATRTRASQCCVRLLIEALRRRGIEAQEGVSFEGYDEGEGDDPLQRFADDLQVLRAKTLELVRRQVALGHHVRIAAQGGYKPETGIMMLVAAEAGVTAYYSHESMRTAVELPVLLYKGSMDGVRALSGEPGRRVAGRRCADLLARFPELAPDGDADRAHVVAYKRDPSTAQAVEVRLTGYGRYLAEQA